MLLSKEKLQTVAIASDDAGRPQLNGIHVAPDGTVTATDGHRLIRVLGAPMDESDYPVTPALEPYPNPVPDAGIILPTGQVKAALKSWPKQNRYIPILNHAKLGVNGDSSCLFTTNLDTSSPTAARMIEGPFPDCDKVIPHDEPAMVVGLNAKYLREMMDAIIRMGVNQADYQVRFEFRGPLKPVMMRACVADGQDVLALLMPLRIAGEK